MSASQQTMKPATAAKKLGVYLPATPEEFQQRDVTRTELKELLTNPPEWLVSLRLNGPHPRAEVARKLGISTSALQRSKVSDAMTTEQIKQLLDDRPEWLQNERRVQAEVRAENARLKARDAERKSGR